MTRYEPSDCTEGWDWTNGKLKFGGEGAGRKAGLRGGVRCWLRSLKTALKALCFQLKHPSRITHTKTYLQPAKSGACYLQRAYKSHLAASGYGISLTHTHTHSSLISALLFSPPLSVLLLFCPPLFAYGMTRWMKRWAYFLTWRMAARLGAFLRRNAATLASGCQTGWETHTALQTILPPLTPPTSPGATRRAV